MTTKDAERAVAELADRIAIDELLSRYVFAIDERGPDETQARALFTDDVVLDFRPDTYTGVDAVAPIHDKIIGVWGPTLHRTTNHVIELDPADADRATVRAKFIASHLHREDDPGAIFHLGADLDAVAVRTASGWRFSQLGLDIVWVEGDPPSPRSD